MAGAEGFDFSAEKPFAVLTAHCAVIHYCSVRILKKICQIKTSAQGGGSDLAGAEGFEPSTKVLETGYINAYSP